MKSSGQPDTKHLRGSSAHSPKWQPTVAGKDGEGL